jgi:uncharacterized membrane protein YgdD (TMEM256/DUF423 family)
MPAENRSALRWIQLGALMGAMSVICGAFGAHGLGDVLLKKYDGQTRKVLGEEIPAAKKYLGDFKTAAEYQMYHAFALLAVGLVGLQRPGRLLNSAGWCFLGGMALFSGSLYVLVLSGLRWLGAITPFGGVLLILGWLLLILATWKPAAPASSS